MGEHFKPIDHASLSRSIKEKWKKVVKVRAMSTFIALITFESKEAMEEALHRDLNWLLSFFNEVRPWSFSEGWQPRKVWIECIGLPPFAWSFDNLSKIGEAWGCVLGFSAETVENKSFCNAYILIETYIKSFIKGWVLLEMEEFSCDLFIKESFRDLGSDSILLIHL